MKLGHRPSRGRRSAFAITNTELNVIAALAMIGLSSTSATGLHPGRDPVAARPAAQGACIRFAALTRRRPARESEAVDPETREALDGLERRLVESTAATHRLIAESEDRMRTYIDVRLTESEERTRRHFDVVGEALRDEIRTLAEGVTTFAQASVRRDAELGERMDRLEPRVLGLEARVSVLEQSRPRRRRRR